MTVSTAAVRIRQRPNWRHAGWAGAIALTTWLSIQVLGPLWDVWRGEASLSHRPLLWLIALALLWGRRAALRQWSAAAPGGRALLLGAAVLYVGAVWADAAFLKPVAFLGMAAGAAGFLGARGRCGRARDPWGCWCSAFPGPRRWWRRFRFPCS